MALGMHSLIEDTAAVAQGTPQPESTPRISNW